MPDVLLAPETLRAAAALLNAPTIDPRYYVDVTAAPTEAVPAVPLYPPGRLFVRPGALAPGTKLTVVTAGPDVSHVYGYAAAWDTCLLNGDEQHECITPTRSPSGYQAAQQGDTVLDDGSVIRTANIGGGVNHALDGTFAMAVDHYANVASQMMRVVFGEDDYGVWFSGALWPHVTWGDVAMLRASSVSGDWRWRREIAGYLGDPRAWDLAGVQLVNSPGYPLYRVAACGDLIVCGGFGHPIEEETMPGIITRACPTHGMTPITMTPVTACTCQTAHTAAPPMEEIPDPVAEIMARLDSLDERLTALEGAASPEAVAAAVREHATLRDLDAQMSSLA